MQNSRTRIADLMDEPRTTLMPGTLAKFENSYTTNRKGCWVWRKWCGPGGFGYFQRGTQTYYANQVAYEHYIGIIPEGLVASPEYCRNPACARPAHQRLISLEERTQHANEWRELKRKGKAT